MGMEVLHSLTFFFFYQLLHTMILSLDIYYASVDCNKALIQNAALTCLCVRLLSKTQTKVFPNGVHKCFVWGYFCTRLNTEFYVALMCSSTKTRCHKAVQKYVVRSSIFYPQTPKSSDTCKFINTYYMEIAECFIIIYEIIHYCQSNIKWKRSDMSQDKNQFISQVQMIQVHYKEQSFWQIKICIVDSIYVIYIQFWLCHFRII